MMDQASIKRSVGGIGKYGWYHTELVPGTGTVILW